MAGMSLIYAIDCLPNTISSNLPFLLAGSVWGIVTNLSDPAYIKAVKKKKRRKGPRRKALRPHPGWWPHGPLPSPQRGPPAAPDSGGVSPGTSGSA
jgi:hypothetical protein